MPNKLTGYLAILGFVCVCLYGEEILGALIFPSVYLDAEYAYHLRTEHLARFIVSGLLISSLVGVALGWYFVILRSKYIDLFFKQLSFLAAFSIPVFGFFYTSYLYVNHLHSWHNVLFDFALLLMFIASIFLFKILDRIKSQKP